MTTCRSCNAPIRWARTPNGKPIPLDAEPDPGGNVVIEGASVRFVAPDLNATGLRYTSHFATCPDAAAHRKKRA